MAKAIYDTYAGPTLRGLLSKVAEMDGDRVTLEQEIDLARATLLRAVNYWSVALEAKTESAMALQLDSEALIREGLDIVQKLVASEAKIRLIKKGAIELNTVQWMVGEISRIIQDKLPDGASKDLIEAISRIELPVDGTLAKFTRTASDEAFL